MKTITLLLILFVTGCASPWYARVGAGAKMDETHIYWERGEEMRKASPISFRGEIGTCEGSWCYGVSHHSQFFDGAPFNDRMEYQKTELFIDYVWEL